MEKLQNTSLGGNNISRRIFENEGFDIKRKRMRKLSSILEISTENRKKLALMFFKRPRYIVII